MSSCPVAASQMRTVKSQLLVDMRRDPFSLKATLVTSHVCPCKENSSFPLATSHTLITGSSPAEATRSPHGLNAMLLALRWPLKDRSMRPVFHSQILIVPSSLAEARRPPPGLKQIA